MSNPQAPFGLRPIKAEGFATRVNYYTLSSASAAIYEGDVCELSSGVVIKSTGTTAITALGVAAKSLSTVVSVTRFPVYDDPGTIFEGRAQASCAQLNVGTRVALNQGTATNYNGQSVETIEASSTSTSYPLIVVGLIDAVDNDLTAPASYARLAVKLQSHIYNA